MSFKSNFMCISSDYGYNKKDFNLINENTKSEKNVNFNNLKNNKVIEKKVIENFSSKSNQEVNTFPLGWTCYRNNNGKWICPMRGDK